MIDALSQLQLLRPLWLLAIIPVSLLLWLLLRRNGQSANWHGAINDSLLRHLSDGNQAHASRWPVYGLWLGLCLAAIALAGPTWEKLPQPVHQRQDALVVVLDLSLSMLAEDIKPSRLVRARHKILDILALRKEGVTGLVAYSGDAHVVTPLTDDTPTIANLVPALSPLMMPVIGSDPASALQLSESLLSSAGISDGRILLITDGISDADLDQIDNQLRRKGIELSVLGVGTRDGAPIPADKGFLKDRDGNIIVPRLDSGLLERLAEANSGRYSTISVNDRDIRFLLPPVHADFNASNTLTEREFDQWQDRGAWLCLLLIPFAAMAFRRGWILSLALPLLLIPKPSVAFEWQDLWQRPDQRAQQQLQAGDAESAAETFENPAWKGSAHYRAENYQASAEQFSQLDSADAHFNRGNALARSGQLEQAIAAYDKALERDPAMEDAKFNRQLVQELLNQQSQQQPDQSDDKQDQQDSSRDKDQQNENQQGQDQQGQDQQGKEQQENNQQQSNQQQNQDQSTANQSRNSSSSRQQNDDSESAAADSEQAQEDKPGQQAQGQTDPEQQDQQQADQDRSQRAQARDDKESSQAESGKQSAAMQAQVDQHHQATEQWLRQIPDDPAGLLRRKFNYESQLRQQQGATQREQPQW